jgi:transmembrane sensor
VERRDPTTFDYLITNKGFVDWVREPNEVRDYFWKRWIEEHPEEASELIRAREFIENLKFNEEKLSGDELDDLLGKIIRKERARTKGKSKRWQARRIEIGWPARVAAVLLMFLAFSGIYYWNSLDRPRAEIAEEVQWYEAITLKGEKQKVKLPDGTLVNLNYESRLKYPAKFTGGIRKVELSGEAFFDVVQMKERPFIVSTADLVTEVFGTTFNVNSFDNNSRVKVSLVSGKVKVKENGNDNSVTLNPGEEIDYDRSSKEMVKHPFDLEKTLAWKNGVLLFEDVSFKEFIQCLEKWYGVNFQVYGAPPKNWSFNGRYENEELENILIGVQFVYKLDYKIQGNNVTIKFM